MRSLTFISLLIFGFSCTNTKNVTMESNQLNGTWLPVKQEFAGSSLPPAAFEKQKLILSDSNYTLIAESVDKGVVKFNGDKMDIYGKEGVNSGKHFMAIYKYENGELTVCYNLAGNGYPEGYDTKNQPLFFLSVFKKEMAK